MSSPASSPSSQPTQAQTQSSAETEAALDAPPLRSSASPNSAPNDTANITRATSTQKDSTNHPPRVQNLGRWFWGTILALALATLILVGLACWHAPERDSAYANNDGPASFWASLRALTAPPPPQELASTRLEQVLQQAQEAALQGALDQIEPLLTAAYQPVFAAIPTYADFHYSVKGEYLELSQAALGNLGSSLQTHLFAGLEQGLEHVAQQLDITFDEHYRSSLQNQISADLTGGDNPQLGPLTQHLLDSTLSRVTVSAPLSALAAVGTAGALKLAGQALAVKIGAKAAAKAGSKAAIKGGTSIVGGAGTGALLCSWAGPAAAGCALAGGVLAWFGTDWLLLKADEHLHREEFEAELQVLIEEQKAVVAEQLKAQLMARAEAVRAMSEDELKAFTLKELTGRPRPSPPAAPAE